MSEHQWIKFRAIDAPLDDAAREQRWQDKLKGIKADPGKLHLRIDQSIKQRNRPGYRQAAEDLRMLAEACGKETAQAKAMQLRAEFPSRSALSAELKKAGF